MISNNHIKRTNVIFNKKTMKSKVLEIRTVIVRKRVRQLVLIKLEGLEKEIYLTPEEIYQNVKVPVNQLEVLIGSNLRVEFYNVGDKLLTGDLCKNENFFVKEYFFELNDSVDNLIIKNRDLLILFSLIIDAYTFNRNGFDFVCFELESGKKVFISYVWLHKYTGLYLNQMISLVDSYIYPTFYKTNEKMYNGKICWSDESIVKSMYIRFCNNFFVTEKNKTFRNISTIVEYDDNYDTYTSWIDDYYEGSGGDEWSDPYSCPGSPI